MGAAPGAKLSVEEYLALDRAAEVKSEYHDGELFPLEAVTWAHARVSFRFAVLLDQQLAKTECQVVPSSLRVQVRPAKFLIPDMLVVCGKLDFTDEHNDTITNPKVIQVSGRFGAVARSI